jgi:hypothetical protein
MPTISDEQWAVFTAHIEALEAQVDFLLRERILLKAGRQGLEQATNPADVLKPCRPGFGRGHNGQEIALTYEAASERNLEWFKPSPRKRVRKPDESPDG